MRKATVLSPVGQSIVMALAVLATGGALAGCGADPVPGTPDGADASASAHVPETADVPEQATGRRIYPATEPRPDDAAPVRLGVDVLLSDSIEVLRGLRVGLITNHTGRGAFGRASTGVDASAGAGGSAGAGASARAGGSAGAGASAGGASEAGSDGADQDGTSTIDLLARHPAIELVALFGPEHGIRGAADAGEQVVSGRDPATGLPIYSLYGEVREPTAEMLAGIDALVFDIQDIGTRYYTYVWTMTLAMQSAAGHGVRFVVLDHPNPIGGEQVQGNVLEPAYATFVGLYPVPMRHGLTAGELARLINAEYDIGADLVVIPVEGWRRGTWYDETGIPWIKPSPNMPSLESATHYPGTCLFEGTNLSVGRGTPRAFQQIGAPWLDHETLVQRLEAYDLPGVRFEAVTFTPDAPGDGKYGGETVRGVRLTVTDRQRYDPTRAAVALLVEIQGLHPEQIEWREQHFDRLAGTARLREQVVAGAAVEEIVAPWAEQLAEFRELREQYLLYR